MCTITDNNIFVKILNLGVFSCILFIVIHNFYFDTNLRRKDIAFGIETKSKLAKHFEEKRYNIFRKNVITLSL